MKLRLMSQRMSLMFFPTFRISHYIKDKEVPNRKSGRILSAAVLLTLSLSCGKHRESATDPKDLAYSRNANNVALLFSSPNNLSGPPTDIKTLKPILEGLSFKVVTVDNATVDDIIRETKKSSKDIGENGTLFWYFSGHGTQQGRLVAENEQLLDFKEVTTAITDVRESPIKRFLVFVDACFSGQLVNGTQSLINEGGAVTSSGITRSTQKFALADTDETDPNDAQVGSSGEQTPEELDAIGTEKSSTGIRAAIADAYHYKTGKVFEQALVMTAARKFETSLDLGRSYGGAFTYSLRKAFSELKGSSGKPTIRDLAETVIAETKDITENAHIPVYRAFPATGVLEDFLFEPSGINVTNDALTLEDGTSVRISLKDSKNAKAFFDAMNIAVTTKSGRQVKEFVHVGEPGTQKLQLTCWRETSREQRHGCDLSVEKRSGWKRAYKTHIAQDDESLFIVRNDTNYSKAAKPIYELFSNAETYRVGSSVDPQIGWTVIGGREFSVPEEDAPMQLRCRNDGSDYFCKFVIKRP